MIGALLLSVAFYFFLFRIYTNKDKRENMQFPLLTLLLTQNTGGRHDSESFLNNVHQNIDIISTVSDMRNVTWSLAGGWFSSDRCGQGRSPLNYKVHVNILHLYIEIYSALKENH